MIYLYILTLFCISLVTASDSDEVEKTPSLKWPSKYTVRATKFYLTSGWSKDYQAWYTKSRSRIDSYEGAAKRIRVAKNKQYRFGVTYKIHPTTAPEEDFNALVCSRSNGTRFNNIEVKQILPDISDDYKAIGTEEVRDKNTVKFYYQETYGDSDIRKTIWASYDDESKSYTPVRYDEKVYNVWYGYLNEHMFWEFYDFERNVDSNVFTVKDYTCVDEESDDDEVVEETDTSMDPENKIHINNAFNSFKRKFGRNYANKREHNMRKKIFARNMRLLLEKNRQNLGYKLTINEFIDKTPDELFKYRGLLKSKRENGNIPFPYTKKRLSEMESDLPSEYDLRLLGLVGPVKQQENCGSCWTWGTTAAVEGALARINGGRLLRLANQAVVDCAWEYGGGGCNGGTDIIAYKWMMDYGLPTEEEYGQYADENGYCKIKNMTTLYPIRGFTDVTPYSESALKIATINHGPLSVSVSATPGFQLYAGGIFYDPSCDPTQLNHEVTLVGYGKRDGETYWILKNSWGPTWGIDGYMHISTRNNNCGVATEPTYAVF